MARRATATPATEATAAPTADTPQEPTTTGTTTLDSDVTKPSTTAPGDGAADTTDPTQIAVSVPPQPGPEALAEGTVNAVKPVEPAPRAARARKKDRIEEYEATRPDGTTVTIVRNIETGETSVK